MFLALPECHCCFNGLQVNKLHSNLFSRCSNLYGKTIWDCTHFLKPAHWLQMTAPGQTDCLKVRWGKEPHPPPLAPFQIFLCGDIAELEATGRSANWESLNNILSLEESTCSWFTGGSTHKPELQQTVQFWRSLGKTEGSSILEEREPVFCRLYFFWDIHKVMQLIKIHGSSWSNSVVQAGWDIELTLNAIQEASSLLCH